MLNKNVFSALYSVKVLDLLKARGDVVKYKHDILNYRFGSDTKINFVCVQTKNTCMNTCTINESKEF